MVVIIKLVNNLVVVINIHHMAFIVQLKQVHYPFKDKGLEIDIIATKNIFIA